MPSNKGWDLPKWDVRLEEIAEFKLIPQAETVPRVDEAQPGL